MPPGATQLIEEVVGAWNRRDLDALLARVHPGAEYVNAPTAIEPGTRTGHEELVEVFRKQWDGLGDARQAVDRFHVRGDEVITEGRLSRTLPGGAGELENRVLLSWTVRGGRIHRLQVLGAGSTFQPALDASGVNG